MGRGIEAHDSKAFCNYSSISYICAALDFYRTTDHLTLKIVILGAVMDWGLCSGFQVPTMVAGVNTQ